MISLNRLLSTENPPWCNATSKNQERKLMDEGLLIKQLIAGEDSAFRQLIAQHHSLMLNIARAIIGDAFADEVVQEAWVSVYKNIASFERRSSLKTWLMTIVSYRIIYNKWIWNVNSKNNYY